MNKLLPRATLWLLPLVAVGCHTDMWRQPKQDAYDPSDFYADGQASRPLIAGTIPREHLRADGAFFTGAENGRYIDRFPSGITVDKALLDRGQERYDVYCSPCHGRMGNGQGMIAQRGLTLKRPVGNYHTDRLRRMPVGHFYDVITNGYGTMYSYASRVEPQDRWAIVAYIRALQLSQDGRSGDLPPETLTQLQSDPKAVVIAERGPARNISGSGVSKADLQKQSAEGGH